MPEMASGQKELIPMRPGELLRHERERAGLTLERASELSRIKPVVLAAIESGETSDIPSVYLRGYIRNYARFLGVEPARIEETLEFAQGSDPGVRTVFSVPIRRGRTEKWLKASSYLAASAIIAALAWQFTHEAVRFSQRDSQAGPSASLPADTAETGAENDPVTSPLSSKTHLNASIAAMEMLEQRRELGGQAAAEEAWAAIGGQSDTDSGDPGDRHRLAVSTSADTWLEILDGDGAQLELDLLRAGSQREYTGTEPFRIMIGRASAVVMSLDGEPVDLGPYTRGNVARLTLGEAGVVSEAESAEAPDSTNR
jgi:cytoskeleton protein RodZ